MISEVQYQHAKRQVELGEKIIFQYQKEKAKLFENRLKNGPVFTDEELRYSAINLCPCGHGLAYPKSCGPGRYWDCSAILKGIQDNSKQHCPQLPLLTTNIKSESDYRGSTRGVFNPQNREE